jgi:D-alanyl-D-alanine carboxypeptidase
MEGCTGLKTGYTKAAGRTLVSCAERNGQKLAVVTLQDGNDWVDHQTLYEYGFSTYPVFQAAVLGQPLGMAPVWNGQKETVTLVAAESFSWPLAEGERLETQISLDASLPAPVSAGTRAGEAVFLLNGREVGRTELLCGESVPPRVASALQTLKYGFPE